MIYRYLLILLKI